MRHRMFGVALALAVMAGLGSLALAQDGGWGRFRRVPPRFATVDTFDGGFNFCRLWYANGGFRREAGGQGWSTDYPDADINFSIRFGELTKARVSRQANGAPNHVVVRANDPLLYQCPFLLAADVGTMELGDDEVQGLRDYLMKGGFLWVDDFWGSRAWDNFEIQMTRVLPGAPYTFRDVDPTHPIYRTMFEVPELPQIPSIQFWRGSGGATSERGSDSATPHMRAIVDPKGRLLVLATHNTDIADAWEREGEDPQFFYNFSPQGYAVALNIVLYVMSH
jgi:Domain of unknown function (DUF4159)